MSALPTIKEELDRKGFETAEWLFLSLDQGKLTPAQFSTGIDALFMAVNGLTDEALCGLLTAADHEAKQEKPAVRHCFLRKNMAVSLTWTVSEDSFEVVNYQDGVEARRITKKFDTAKEACVAMQKATSTFVGAGFIKL